MANAFVICSALKADAVKIQAASKHIELKQLECENQEMAVFYTRARFFEEGGVLTDTIVVKTDRNDVRQEVERQAGGKVK